MQLKQRIECMRATGLGESKRTVGAQGTRGVRPAAPGGLHLVMMQFTQKDIFITALQFRESATERILCPALGIGFFRIGKEAIEGSNQLRDQTGEGVVFYKARSPGDNEVVAAADGLPDQGDAVRIEGAVLESVERVHLFIKAGMRHEVLGGKVRLPDKSNAGQRCFLGTWICGAKSGGPGNSN
jgi:hypothetical protein